ncbi:MAG: lipoyl(octanoyl) transferase LipB [Desulfobia sp.]
MSKRCCGYFELPVIDYEKARDLQLDLVEGRKSGRFSNDMVILLEHSPVFTLGRRGKEEYLHVGRDFLDKKGISLVHAERGGFITYHAPGQLIVYAVFDLGRIRLGVKDFIYKLEEVMLCCARDEGVPAHRDPLNRGVWTGPRKLGSVGIALRQGITFHGLALNVALELAPFTWINPCGLKGLEMTSLQEESANVVSVTGARNRVKGHIEEIFNVELLAMTAAEAGYADNTGADRTRAGGL